MVKNKLELKKLLLYFYTKIYHSDEKRTGLLNHYNVFYC